MEAQIIVTFAVIFFTLYDRTDMVDSDYLFFARYVITYNQCILDICWLLYKMYTIQAMHFHAHYLHTY